MPPIFCLLCDDKTQKKVFKDSYVWKDIDFSMVWWHSEMFSKVLFRCENVGRQRDLGNFWHFLTWFQSFFNPIEFLGLKKVNWVWKKTEIMWENVKNLQNHLVGRRFHNETKPRETFHCAVLQFMSKISSKIFWNDAKIFSALEIRKTWVVLLGPLLFAKISFSFLPPLGCILTWRCTKGHVYHA